MPARSEAQRKYIYANMGAAWAKLHHFDTKGPLPKRANKKRKGPSFLNKLMGA